MPLGKKFRRPENRVTYTASLVIDPGDDGTEERYVNQMNQKADELMRKIGLFARPEFDLVVRRELKHDQREDLGLIVKGHTHYLYAEITL